MARARKAPGARSEDGAVDELAERRMARNARAGRDSAAEPAAAQEPAEKPKKRESREARARRVAELKERIASGDYNPDAREIARKILERGF